MREFDRRLYAAVKALHENPEFFRQHDSLLSDTCEWILDGAKRDPKPVKPATALNRNAQLQLDRMRAERKARG